MTPGRFFSTTNGEPNSTGRGVVRPDDRIVWFSGSRATGRGVKEVRRLAARRDAPGQKDQPGSRVAEWIVEDIDQTCPGTAQRCRQCADKA